MINGNADLRRRAWRAVRMFAVCLVGASLSGADAPFEWQRATPEKHGFSSAKLDALRDDLAARRTKALFIVHDDRVIYEWYSADHSATKPHGTASMAKAIVGGVSLAVALSDGLITLDTVLAEKWVPQWRTDPMKTKITVRHLGSHTSGLEDAEADKKPHAELTGWKGDFWKRHAPPNDPFTLSRDASPIVFSPGTSRAYSNPGIAMMDYAVTAALRDAPEKDLRSLLRERIMRPIGAADAEWSCGYGQTFQVDGLPLVGSWGGGNFTARATARICRLMLREGDWEGRRLLSAAAVRQITRDARTPGPGGMGWWNTTMDTLRHCRATRFGVPAPVGRSGSWCRAANSLSCAMVALSRRATTIRPSKSICSTDWSQRLRRRPKVRHETIRNLLLHDRGDPGGSRRTRSWSQHCFHPAR